MDLSNVERISPELRAGSFEFLYADNVPVRKGTPYMIFYTKSKMEIFLTRRWAEIFVRNPEKHYTMFGQYVGINRSKAIRESYLKPHSIEFTPAMEKKDCIFRYFAKYYFDETIFEINKQDFNEETNFYQKIGIFWQLQGSQESIKMKNEEALEQADNELKGMRYLLDPLEFSKEEKLTKLEKIQQKLSNLKY